MNTVSHQNSASDNLTIQTSYNLQLLVEEKGGQYQSDVECGRGYELCWTVMFRRDIKTVRARIPGAALEGSSKLAIPPKIL